MCCEKKPDICCFPKYQNSELKAPNLLDFHHGGESDSKKKYEKRYETPQKNLHQVNI